MPSPTHSKIPILIFADGACSGNPGPGGWGAIVVIPEGHVRELGGGDPRTTNNQMELMATIRALEEIAHLEGEVEVYTDSTYVIRGITQWIWGWRNRDWKTAEGKDVANVDLWKQLAAVTWKRNKASPIHWKYVRGHSGIPGNERVDEIAVLFSKGSRPKLYDGKLLGYGVAIHDIPENTELPEMKPKPGPKAAAYSYLSYVGSTAKRHKTWAECEARVKGQSGAKFKKAMSEEEDRQILRSWGFDPEKV